MITIKNFFVFFTIIYMFFVFYVFNFFCLLTIFYMFFVFMFSSFVSSRPYMPTS
jgi:hypothetical protein